MISSATAKFLVCVTTVTLFAIGVLTLAGSAINAGTAVA